MSKNMTAEQVVAQKFADDKITLEEFQQTMAALRGGSVEEAPAEEQPRQRKPVLVELSDDYRKGHVVIWKTLDSGKKIKGIMLDIDIVDDVVAEIQAVAELVREDLAQS